LDRIFALFVEPFFCSVGFHGTLKVEAIWPIKGIPSKLEGTFFDDLLHLVSRRKMGTGKIKMVKNVFISAEMELKLSGHVTYI
jgi:hypothetical protein